MTRNHLMEGLIRFKLIKAKEEKGEANTAIIQACDTAIRVYEDELSRLGFVDHAEASLKE